MSTSGTYSFVITRDDIIRQALLNIKRLDEDEAPTAAAARDCAFMLNMMVKQWQGKSDFAPGLKTWTRKTGYLLLSNTNQYLLGPDAQGWTNSFTRCMLTAGAAAGALSLTVDSTSGAVGSLLAIELDSGQMQFVNNGVIASATSITFSTPLLGTASSGNYAYVYASAAQKPIALETVWLRDAYYSDTPIRVMNVQDYSNLPNKSDPLNIGDPAAIYWEEGIADGNLYLDVGVAQDISKYLMFKYLEPGQIFNTATDNPYFPEEWFLALCWGLTEQIAPMFSASWNDKMEQLKTTALAIARNKGAEMSSMYFQPGVE